MKNTVNEAASTEMKALDRLVGVWKISGSGGVNGTATFEWIEGGFFLMQRGVMEHEGYQHKALQIIGSERVDGAERTVIARAFTSTGETAVYIYELKGDILTIWSGAKGSDTYSKSTFSEDGNTLTGAWTWPGGGYQFVMTRISERPSGA